jgi:amino acid transporter
VKYLLWLILYLMVCAGGRVLLRRLRSDRDVFLHLRASQGATLAGVVVSGVVTAALLGVSLWGAFQGRVTPPAWKVAVVAGVALTLLLLLVQYAESDWVQMGVFCAVAFFLFLCLAAIL